jgi:deoxyribodipyrimidine photo-lyase
MFPTDYASILAQLQSIKPVEYGATRNYLDGAVTRLSPYISRGVISTRQVYDAVVAAGHAPHNIVSFIQELAWRDYWQQLWITYRSHINADLRQPQPLGVYSGIPLAMTEHHTGIHAIDSGIEELYTTGYMHNHLRMYVASMACNIARCQWKIPAQWMYYHLLDADWASNALSWQWVCGANSKKIYYANQENINRYCATEQTGTFLDRSYESLETMAVPDELKIIVTPRFTTTLPSSDEESLDPELPTLIYNFYNLDPNWRKDEQVNRVLLLEPSVFEQYPVSEKSIAFCLALAKENIPSIRIRVGELAALREEVNGKIIFKEHPLNNYSGEEDPRTWLTTVQGEHPSFFAFWKRCQKQLL